MKRQPEQKREPEQAVEQGIERESSVGLYVHVPFCERVCPYCDFAVVSPAPTQQGESRYRRALLRELEARRALYPGRTLETIYFGGGTPSLMSPESIHQLIEAASRSFGALALQEVTLEVNPSTLERARLPEFKSAGVTRLSLGIQSFNDKTLKRLGRAHHAKESWQTLEDARKAGFQNLSLDLIYAAPQQSFAEFDADLTHALEFGPEHLSAYELTIEEGTPFALAEARDQLGRVDDDTVARMYATLALRASEAGIARYEISNYARPGFEAVHNARYWRREPVLGIGVGAFSSEPFSSATPFGARRANTRDLADYYARVESGASAEVDYEVHSEQEARGEAMFLSLRHRDGVDAAAFEAEFGASPRDLYAGAIDSCVSAGQLLEDPRGNLRLSTAGQLLSDTVFARFI